MGFLVKRPPKLSSGAREFVREHPEEARVAVAVALETALYASYNAVGAACAAGGGRAPRRRFVVDLERT